MTVDAIAHTWLTAAVAASVRGGLALCVAWGVSLAPRVPAAVRCWAWRAAYAVLLASFAWTTPVDVPVLRPIPVMPKVVALLTEPRVYTRGFVVADDPEPAVTVPPAPAPSPTMPLWPSILFASWLAYVVAFAVRLCVGWRTANRLRRSGEPADIATLRRLCAAAGVRRPPGVRVGGVRGPLLVGLLRPVVLLPAGLPPASLDAVVAHELAHLRRRDLWWNWLPTLAAGLLPWHPLVWPCNRRWRLAAEAACDADAIAITAADPAAYGRALLSVVTGPRGPTPLTLAVGAAESRWSLKRRLVAMNTITRWSRRRRWVAAIVLTAAGVAAAVPWRAVARAADGPPPSTGPTDTQQERAARQRARLQALQAATSLAMTDARIKPTASELLRLRAALAALNASGGLPTTRGTTTVILDPAKADRLRAEIDALQAEVSRLEAERARLLVTVWPAATSRPASGPGGSAADPAADYDHIVTAELQLKIDRLDSLLLRQRRVARDLRSGSAEDKAVQAEITRLEGGQVAVQAQLDEVLRASRQRSVSQPAAAADPFATPPAGPAGTEPEPAGTVIARTMRVRVAAAGTLTRVAFEPGQAVRAGDVLVELDATAQRAALDVAKATLDEAKGSLARKRQMAAAAVATVDEVELAASQVKVAEASLTAHQHEVEQRTMRAAFDGVMGPCDHGPGEVVTTADDLGELTQTTDYTLHLDGRVAAGFKPGDRLAVWRQFQSNDRQAWAVVTYVGVAVHDDGLSVDVRGRLVGNRLDLRPGERVAAKRVAGAATKP